MGKKQNARQSGHFTFQNVLPFAEEKFPWIGHPTLEIFCRCFVYYEMSTAGQWLFIESHNTRWRQSTLSGHTCISVVVNWQKLRCNSVWALVVVSCQTTLSGHTCVSVVVNWQQLCCNSVWALVIVSWQRLLCWANNCHNQIMRSRPRP
jgi:hypothetical protein